MIHRTFFVVALLLSGTPWLGAEDSDSPQSKPAETAASTLAEARTRAKMLHEMVRGTLQIMHRDFFDEDDAHAIPSASLEDVFHEMSETHDVTMKWLIVNTDIVNADHEAETPFEKAAVKTLAAGEPFAEHRTATRYQFAGPIRLGSQCLKCHVKRRIRNEARTAGLVISMPLVESDVR